MLWNQYCVCMNIDTTWECIHFLQKFSTRWKLFDYVVWSATRRNIIQQVNATQILAKIYFYFTSWKASFFIPWIVAKLGLFRISSMQFYSNTSQTNSWKPKINIDLLKKMFVGAIASLKVVPWSLHSSFKFHPSS